MLVLGMTGLGLPAAEAATYAAASEAALKQGV
jgi:hypothetical protein